MENIMLQISPVKINKVNSPKKVNSSQKDEDFHKILAQKKEQDYNENLKADEKIEPSKEKIEKKNVEKTKEENKVSEDEIKQDEIKKDEKEDIKKEIPEDILQRIMELIQNLESMDDMKSMDLDENASSLEGQLIELKQNLIKTLELIKEDGTIDLQEMGKLKEDMTLLLDKLQSMNLNTEENVEFLKKFEKLVEEIQKILEENKGLQLENKDKESDIVKNTNSISTEKKEEISYKEVKTEEFTQIREVKNGQEQNQNSFTENQESKEEKGGFFAFSQQKVVVTDKMIQDIPTQFVMPNVENVSDTLKAQMTTIQKPSFEPILSQIIEKANIMIDDENSEMSFQLKPENLGKLSMNISVERGIVVANIVAENQAVKETLESNFNLLKDALQEKGLGIEQFNVSVGQDSKENQHQGHMNFKKKNTKSIKGIMNQDLENIDENIHNIDSLDDSKINQLG